MKVLYRRGDSFELPLGDGTSARSCIVHCEHRVVIIAIGGEAPLAVLRVSDDALVAQRWKTDQRTHAGTAFVAENARWISAARAERQGAARLGHAHPRERRRRVFEFRDDTRLPDAVDDDTIVTVASALSPERVHALVEVVANHPRMMVRLLAPAVGHLAAFAPHLHRLTIAAPLDAIVPMPQLIELEVDGPLDLRSLSESAPRLQSLSWRASGDFDPKALRAFPALHTLSLAGVRIENDAFPQLRHLRLARTTGLRGFPAIASLRTLALEHLHDLAQIDQIARCRELTQMELRGLWQFDIADAEFALDLPHLVRAEIDIGGRRKNLELYRRAAWAYPWRFPGTIDA